MLNIIQRCLTIFQLLLCGVGGWECVCVCESKCVREWFRGNQSILILNQNNLCEILWGTFASGEMVREIIRNCRKTKESKEWDFASFKKEMGVKS